MKKIIIVIALLSAGFVHAQVGFNTTGYINTEGDTDSYTYYAVAI